MSLNLQALSDIGHSLQNGKSILDVIVENPQFTITDIKECLKYLKEQDPNILYNKNIILKRRMFKYELTVMYHADDAIKLATRIKTILIKELNVEYLGDVEVELDES